MGELLASSEAMSEFLGVTVGVFLSMFIRNRSEKKSFSFGDFSERSDRSDRFLKVEKNPIGFLNALSVFKCPFVF